MAAVCEQNIDLFGQTLPSIDKLQQLADQINSSEKSRIAFSEQLTRQTGASALAKGAANCILSNWTAAIECLNSAPDDKEKFILLAYAYRRNSNFDMAVDALNKAKEHQAEALLVHLETAAVLRDAGKVDKAFEQFKLCGNFENLSAQYHYELGRCYQAAGDYKTALEQYSKALDISPEHRKSMFHFAYLCDLRGDEEMAEDYYLQLAGEKPVHVSALINLAVLYEDRGEYQKAKRCIEKILKYHPNHQRAILFMKDIESSMTMVFDEELQKSRDNRNKILETPISDFELSVRSRNCLKKMGINTLGDLLKITEAELLAYKNFGETSLHEINTILDSKGLYLGQAVEGHPRPDKDEIEEEPVEENADLARSIDEFNFSVRAKKCLQQLNINTIGELVQKTDAELLGCKNFGVTSLDEIKKMLDSIGLSLKKLD